jgi:hypothetical protein
MKSRAISKNYIFLKPKIISNLIRLGKNFDGGYIVSEGLIKKSDGLISFGYGNDSSLELDYIRMTNKQVYIYDYTFSIIELTKILLKYFRRFITFRKKFEDVIYHYKILKNYFKLLQNKKIFFFRKKITRSKKKRIDVNIEEIFNKFNFNNNLILKCDIEGSEYEIIEDLLLYKNKICMIIFEFHWIDKNKELFLEKIKKIQDHFSIIHIHGNNHFNFLEDGSNIPIILEITFANNKYVLFDKEDNSLPLFFPIKYLDQPCSPLKDDLYFHFN